MKCPMCNSKLKLKGFKLNKKRTLYYWCDKCLAGFKPHELLEVREGEQK